MTALSPGYREFIKYRPSKEFLVNYFRIIEMNDPLYMVFIKAGGKATLCYELENKEIYTYRLFVDKAEAQFYASFVARKNNIGPEYVDISSMSADELVKFMVSLQYKNPDKVMRMMSCAFFGNNISEVDTFWSNAVKYTC